MSDNTSWIIKKGLDLPFLGALSSQPSMLLQQIEKIAVSKAALVAYDFKGLKPKMLVQEGDRVKLGSPLFLDKRLNAAEQVDDDQLIPFVAPASGKICAIHRGYRRRLLSVEIELDQQQQSVDLSIDGGSPKSIRRSLATAGLWTHLRTRPFSQVPALQHTPKSIFVTAIDSNPLAVDPTVIIEHHIDEFNEGLRILSQLARVHVCVAQKLAKVTSSTTIKQHLFQGKHPAGLAGTHIHFIDPVGLNQYVWTIGYQAVIAIGHLFLYHKIWQQRYYALAGPSVKKPALILAQQGASTEQLCTDKLKHEASSVRIISGSPLCGHEAKNGLAFVGPYHNQICVLQEGYERPMLHFIQAGRERFSVLPIYVSKFFKNKLWDFTTTMNGSDRAMVPIEIYEQVMPLDMLPIPLLKSLIVEDIQMAMQLGALELDEEDLALSTYVCPGKHDYGQLLRNCLTRIEKES